MDSTKLLKGVGLTGALFLASVAPALAQDAAPSVSAPPVSGEVAYIFNTLLFLICGFLVMWMAAGFAMLEAGLVRSKNVSMQCLKNIGLYSAAGLMFWILGYNLAYPSDWAITNWIGANWWHYSIDAVSTAATGDDGELGGYSLSSDWFFQMVFAATAASIVSGTLAERIKLWPFLIFVVVLTGIIYPIGVSWQWGGGVLSELGFSDFAGSSIVHSVGGWAALAGALVLGARKGKYKADGSVNPMPGSSIPLATLGTFILWLGWFGFNGGSQLELGSIASATDVSRIFVNTNIAAAAGVIAAIILTQIFFGKVDVTMALNGALAGLVSITAEPLAPEIWESALIGAVGGMIVVIFVPLLDKLKIDDVVGAIPVHLIAGIWGTLIVAWNTQTEGQTVASQFVVQASGVIYYAIWAFIASIVVWIILRMTLGIRANEEQEALGMDKSEVGVEAYPEFSPSSSGL